MATHAPRSKAHETLTAAEVAALTESAARAGGWRALARGWEALGATTLQRLARGASATPTVLFTVRAQLAAAPAPTTPPSASGDAAERLRAEGVLLEPGRAFFDPARPVRNHYRLAYSSSTPVRIPEGVAKIASGIARGLG